MTKGTSIATNRLRAALAERGIDVKHSVAREIVAAAFGFRSSNDMDEQGIDIPVAEESGDASQHQLAAFRDPHTGGIFAVDRSMLPEPGDRRSGSAIVSPYGSLLALPAKTAAQADVPPVQIIIATPDDGEGALYWSDGGGWTSFAGADLYAPGAIGRLPDAGMPEGSVFTIPLASGCDAWMLDWDERLHDDVLPQILRRPIRTPAGISFSHGHAMIRNGDERFLLLAAKGTDIERFASYLDAMRDLFENAAIEPFSLSGHLGLLIPAGYMRQAASGATWRDAMEDLLVPVGERPRVIAEFTPEASFNDHIMPVDAEGDASIDVTFEILLMGRQAASEIVDRDYSSDDLREALRSPEWIRGWTGPFSVEVEESIQDFHETSEGR